MRRKAGTIPVNNFGGELNERIVVERIAFADLPDLSEWSQPERHDRHSFFLLEKGAVTIKIDFEQYTVQSSGVIYMHPDQVHRVIGFESVTVSAWALHDEDLQPEYVQALQDLAPAKPLTLEADAFSLLTETVNLCLKFVERKAEPLRVQCNALVGLVISLYGTNTTAPPSRFEVLTKSFRQVLERDYARFKRPANYAHQLHVSAPYLNECVRNATGFPVSWHIQQRVILEAKRMLYHSDSSFKEIAAVLGYDDYAYFSRLFSKVAGMSPSAFRAKTSIRPNDTAI